MFDRGAIVAGSAERRVRARSTHAWRATDVDAIIAVRGGYGSVELLPLARRSRAAARSARPRFVGYSDVTSLHAWLNGHVGMTSVHGADDRRPSGAGPGAYDAAIVPAAASAPSRSASWRRTGSRSLRPGEADGPLFGGTLTQLAASLGHAVRVQSAGRRTCCSSRKSASGRTGCAAC